MNNGNDGTTATEYSGVGTQLPLNVCGGKRNFKGASVLLDGPQMKGFTNGKPLALSRYTPMNPYRV
jgi:hypothetical protein